MPIHEQRIVGFARGAVETATRHMATAGARAVAAKGGRLFGVFKPVIGMSQNAAVVIVEWPDEAAALAHGPSALDGVAGGQEIDRDLWEPSPRPAPGEVPLETAGFFSHRAFDIRPADWPRFRDISVAAWDNFEGTHASSVKGFWLARRPPAPGLLRVRLMAWYESLDAWERSRFWSPRVKPGAEAANARFRERAAMTEDTHVSILQRVAS